MDVRTAVGRFFERSAALDTDSGYDYFLDLLDLVEEHRAELRGAEWPSVIPVSEATVYRAQLLVVQHELGSFIREHPNLPTREGELMAHALTGILQAILGRMRAIHDRLAGATQH